jgi:hypothetical protein
MAWRVWRSASAGSGVGVFWPRLRLHARAGNMPKTNTMVKIALAEALGSYLRMVLDNERRFRRH